MQGKETVIVCSGHCIGRQKVVEKPLLAESGEVTGEDRYCERAEVIGLVDCDEKVFHSERV